MELEELIITWKQQDKYIDTQLRDVTLQHLLKDKSKDALRKIKTALTKELLLIILASIFFDVLFFLVSIRHTPFRWGCFVIFNLTAFLYIISYLKVIHESKLEYGDDLEANLQRIVQRLTRFRRIYYLLNIPIVFISLLMFAGSQGLLLLTPWMAVEFLILRWMFLPKMISRFEDYKTDLEYSLRQLREI